VVTQAELDAGGNIVNVAVVTGTGATGDDDDATTPVAQTKTLHIEKDAAVPGGTADVAGETISYTMAVTNTGNAAIAGVVVTDAFTSNEAPVLVGGFNSGDADTDGLLDVSETWHYTASHVVTQAELDAGGNIVNVAVVTGTGATGDDDDATTPVAQSPAIKIDKQISANGTTWYDVGKGTLDFPAVLAGSTIKFRVIVTNTGNVSLTAADVTDVIDAGLTGLNFTFGAGNSQTVSLAVGQSVTSNIVTVTNVTGTHTDIATVTANLTVTDSDTAQYTTVAPGILGLTPGFWGQHQDAWDGVIKTPNDPNSKLVTSGVLSKADVLPNHGLDGDPGAPGGVGVLLGDINANGKTDLGETTLWVPLTVAQQQINSSDAAADTRQILLKHALAAQLNIDNGANDPGHTTVGTDLISDAVKWLEGKGPFIYSGSSGNIDTLAPYGQITAANGAGAEYNTKTAAFTSTALTSSKSAWQTLVDTGIPNPGTSTTPNHDFWVNGEGLKNALQAFNQGQLATNGQQVFWLSGGFVTDVHANDASGMWSVLKDAGLKGIA
jgi:uncharacterized repeat protein (TIGR01451 family)